MGRKKFNMDPKKVLRCVISAVCSFVNALKLLAKPTTAFKVSVALKRVCRTETQSLHSCEILS